MKKIKVYIGDASLNFQEQLNECENYYNILKNIHTDANLVNIQFNNNLNILGYFEYSEEN